MSLLTKLLPFLKSVIVERIAHPPTTTAAIALAAIPQTDLFTGTEYEAAYKAGCYALMAIFLFLGKKKS